MNHLAEILLAEKKFKKPLEEFFTLVWKDTLLFSHGLSHHKRVWNYAREMVADPALHLSCPEGLAEKLILACYLHDIGMSSDPGLKHGKLGSEICRQFLHANRLNVNDYSEVLHAIENHDNKEYNNQLYGSTLLKILSAADDLDAFGYIGIYRYMEIYLKRGVCPDNLGYEVKENAGNRFRNFLAGFGVNNKIVEKHRRRYLILDNFFAECSQGSDNFKIFEILYNMIYSNIPPEKFLSDNEHPSTEQVILEFLTNLDNELAEQRL